MSEQSKRIMRIPIPVSLIREMDDVIIRGVGGYSTRSEFIVDAIQERVLELTIEVTEDAGPPPGGGSIQALESETALDSDVSEQSMPYSTIPASISMTVLAAPGSGFSVPDVDNLSRPAGQTLFGFHNRDYPALWALSKLAAIAGEEPVPMEEFETWVLKEAWKFGEVLLAIENKTGAKCTALFPTNKAKRKTAELGFRQFAIGDYRASEEASIATSGPLFEWRVVGLCGSPAEPRIGLTTAGWQLVAAVDGLTIEQPHPHQAAEAFLAHLEVHAPADKRGFIEILRAIGTEGVARQNVLDHVGSEWPEWTKNETSTNAGGYIARAREWGLIQPKQTESKYHLTSLGREYLNGGEQ